MMSVECAICERDLRGSHHEECPKHPRWKAYYVGPITARMAIGKWTLTGK